MTPPASPEMDEDDQRSVRPATSWSLIVRHPGNPQAGIHPER